MKRSTFLTWKKTCEAQVPNKLPSKLKIKAQKEDGPKSKNSTTLHSKHITFMNSEDFGININSEQILADPNLDQDPSNNHANYKENADISNDSRVPTLVTDQTVNLQDEPYEIMDIKPSKLQPGVKRKTGIKQKYKITTKVRIEKL